jgi:hypothetical protein
MDMFEDINEKIVACKARIREREKLVHRIKLLRARRDEQLHAVALWQEHLTEEEKDVRKLESVSFTALWASVIGQKTERLQKEQAEALEARLKSRLAAEALERTEADLKAAEAEYAAVGWAEAELEALLREKEQLVRHDAPMVAAELMELAGKQESLRQELKEWKEAQREGVQASQALAAAQELLESAKSWGVYDMLGGGWIATSVKHDRMDEALLHLQHLRSCLTRFHEELEDVKLAYAAEALEMDGLLRFSDYFFDGLLVDMAVQGQIKDALEQLSGQEELLTPLLQKLGREISRCEGELSLLASKSRALLEEAGGR